MSDAPPPSSRRPGLGIGWLVTAILAAGVLAVVVAAPGVLRGLAPANPAPGGPGEPPRVAGEVQATLKAREQEAAIAQVQVRTRAQQGAAAGPEQTAGPAIQTTKATTPDEARAAGLLAQAQQAYRALQWQKARSLALQISSYQATSATMVQARNLAVSAETLDHLFRQLDERDELQRNYETHPSLVTVSINGKPTLAVPTQTVGDKPTVVESEPVKYLEGQRRVGQLTLLVQGKSSFTPTTLKAGMVGEIAAVDLAPILAERRREFQENLQKLKAGSGARDATAWYAAGRFAYRNRLDDVVADTLDQALRFDPRLVVTVREEKAQNLFASLIAHLKDGNKTQAAAYMAAIARRYADTEQGRQARMYYDGKTSEFVAAARAAAEKEKADAAARDIERLRRAKEEGDLVEAKAIEVERAKAAAQKPGQVEPEDADEPAAPMVTGDEAKADQLAEQASAKARQAMDLGNCKERDDLYHAGRKLAQQAMELYNVLVEKAKDPKRKEELEAKSLAANKVRFMCIKYARPFH